MTAEQKANMSKKSTLSLRTLTMEEKAMSKKSSLSLRKLCSSRKMVDNTKSTRRILSLASRGSWKTLSAFLDSKEGACGSRDIHLTTNDSGSNALHVACQLHPPLDIITKLVESCPHAISQVDQLGRTPLHMAAAWGASPQVVSYLIGEYAKAASARDAVGKTPLISACENCCFEDTCDPGTGDGETVKGPVVDVVRALCRAAPKMVSVGDSEGITALEYALHFSADENVVKALYEALKESNETLKKDGCVAMNRADSGDSKMCNAAMQKKNNIQADARIPVAASRRDEWEKESSTTKMPRAA